jgi:O-antigen/teichoic acid export membrane protein
MRTVTRGGAEYGASIVTGLILIPVVLHRVGPQAFGTWVAISTVLAVGGLADVGIRTEVTRRVAAAWGVGDHDAAKRATREGASILAASGGVLVLLGVVGASTVSSWVFPHGVPGIPRAELDALIRACVVLLGVGLVAEGHFAVLRGVQRTDLESICRTIGDVCGSLVTILWVLAGGGIWALFAGAAVQLSADYLGRAWATHRVVPGFSFRVVRPRHLRLWLAASTLLVTAQVSDVVDVQWDKLVLTRYVGPAGAAAYSVGSTIVGQTKVLIILPLVPLLAAAAELGSTNPGLLERTYRRLGAATITLGPVLLGGVVIFAPAFIRLWLGSPGLPGAGLAAQLLSVAVLLNVLPACLVMLEIGSGRRGAAALAALANILTNGTVSLLLTRRIGFDGALYGSIAGNGVGLVVFFLLVRPQGRFGLPGLRTGAVAAAVAAIGDWVWTAAGGPHHAGWLVLVGSGSAFLVAELTAVTLAAGKQERDAWSSLLLRRGARRGAVGSAVPDQVPGGVAAHPPGPGSTRRG